MALTPQVKRTDYFQLSALGKLSFVDQQRHNLVEGQIISSSLVMWWGVKLVWQEQKNNQQITWFIYRDSLADDDFRRLARTVYQVKQPQS
ncbi:hypothetical protein LP316_15040 [Thalassotalea sp. LPB0316]|uniref:protein YgfX n=1 Tax=Thalassotalea sp. LPB0316 TaxID=2769490 RepID=UPI0018693680|nr:hypothetical protein LP316_15040 [Thalassotalea sp. LPB0316]